MNSTSNNGNSSMNAPKAPVTATTTTASTATTSAPATAPAPTTAPAAPAEPETAAEISAEELCGSENILDTVHLKNLVDDLSKLYSTSVWTKVAKDTKVASEKRLIEAIRANLDRYKG